MANPTPDIPAISSVDDIDGVVVGHATNDVGLTGCTAILFPDGAVAAHRVFGVASGSRELPVFSPRHATDKVHGVCFSGGSAFGLASANGVVRRLAEADIGHVTGAAKVPLVAGAVVYDLALGDAQARPDEKMGWQAADDALSATALARSGNIGAGTGVTAGKLLGIDHATKTGLGNAAAADDEGLQIAALVVLNPVGDVRDPTTGELVAGTRCSAESRKLAGSSALIRGGARCAPLYHNTTLCVVATNATLSAIECEWVAEQAGVALARSIDPPFTRHDGDVVICASLASAPAPRELHRVGVLATDVTTTAILDACQAAEPAGGLPAARELTGASTLTTKT